MASTESDFGGAGMESYSRRRIICAATGLSAPLLLAASRASASMLGGKGSGEDDKGLLAGQAQGVDARRCKAGYVWDSKRKRCVPDPDVDCFVTTACCGAVGLPDDCFELEQLRRFREAVMRPTDRGRRVIDEYSIVGPEILRNIPEKERYLVLCNFYAVYVLPCVLLSRLGSKRTVMKLYAFGAIRLLKKYAPHIYAERAAHWRRVEV